MKSWAVLRGAAPPISFHTWLATCVFAVVMSLTVSSALAAPSDLPFTAASLTEALGMGIMFETQLGEGPDTALNDPYLTAYGDVMEAAGFDAIRIRIGMEQFEASSGPAPGYSLTTDFVNDLTFLVDDILGRGMMALISPKGIEDGTTLSRDKQAAWWGQIAVHFQNHSHRLLFNLLNEPLAANFPNGIADIEDLYAALVAAVRPTNPTRHVVLLEQRISDEGPGETDFNVMAIPPDAEPYIMDFHVLGGVGPDQVAKKVGKLRQAWEFREATGTPVWVGAWNHGNWTDGFDFTELETVAQEFGDRKIPGIYLLFNGGAAGIYDTPATDRDGDGIYNEWNRPEVLPIVTTKGPYDWLPGGVHPITSYHARADAHVKSTDPASNFASTSDVDVSGTKESHFEFDVGRLPSGTVTNAILRVHCTQQGGDVIEVLPTITPWDETAITWNTRPAISGPVLDAQVVGQTGTWFEFDVTDVVTGNGTYGFVLSAPTPAGNTSFRSRDHDWGFDPDLVITVDPGILIATTKLRLQDDSGIAPNPSKRKIRFGARTKEMPTANRIVSPPRGSAGDPRTTGATLTVYNSNGGTQTTTVSLPAAEWVAVGTDADPKGYQFKTADPMAPLVFKVKVGDDTLRVVGRGPSWAYPLSAPPQGSVALRLQLGSGVTWCADAPARSGGSPPSTAKYDIVGKFVAEKQLVAPSTCPLTP